MSATPLRMVVGIIGACLLACIGGIILLASRGQAVPDVLQNVAVGSLTGLVGVLVPTRTSDRSAP